MVSSLKIGNNRLVFTFDESTQVVPENVIRLVTENAKKYKITPEMKLISIINDNSWRSVINEIETFVKTMTEV